MISGVTLTRISILLMVTVLAACAGPTSPVESSNSGRYEMENDSPELEPFDLTRVQAVIPVRETRTLAGNKSPYTINGRTYRVMSSEAGYSATGTASWYGRKFHGHRTSNGEIYDMFQLSAAHTSLPIPSYVRVTNLDNGRDVVVRVNDRGPFHSDRIIDLSYAAATMLGYADRGTARVRVEAIVPGQTVPGQTSPALVRTPVLVADNTEEIATERQRIEEGQGQEYLQVGAFSSLDSAQGILRRVSGLTTVPAFIRSDPVAGAPGLLHRVRLGPLNETMDLDSLINAIVRADLGTPFKVTQ